MACRSITAWMTVKRREETRNMMRRYEKCDEMKRNEKHKRREEMRNVREEMRNVMRSEKVRVEK